VTSVAYDRFGVPECPSADCLMCTGEACNKCGAGCWSQMRRNDECEHDVMERHEEPAKR
jgi:hypothetical protein